MQALFEGSAEAPEASGLGILSGRAQRFSGQVRVPHMGWNQVQAKAGSRLFQGLEDGPWFYFAHSYYVAENAVTAGVCEYSITYSAAIEFRNMFGVQFHPEKSGTAGQVLFKAFLNL